MESVLPKARKDRLLVHELADELLVYDLESHKAHCLNKTAALVWQHCDGEVTIQETIEFLNQALPTSVNEEIVLYAVAQLSKAALLKPLNSTRTSTQGISRRQVIQTLGLAAASALPMITSIVSPQAASAASCVPKHQGPCGPRTNCCSGIGNCAGQSNKCK